MENITAAAVIIGVVRGVVLGFGQMNVKVTSLIGFILALIAGVVLGFLGYFGLNVETGIVTALIATGVYQTAKKVGGE